MAFGLSVNNTFQTGEGWRANLHDGKDGFIFAHGETPTEALTLADVADRVRLVGWV